MKPIRLSAHALSYTEGRGFSAAEVERAIRNSPWEAAELGRLHCRMDFIFGREGGRVGRDPPSHSEDKRWVQTHPTISERSC